MSLFLSALAFLYVGAFYWFRLGGQYDSWGFSKGFAAALLVGVLVHRLVWIVLTRLDDIFNHPPPMYTSFSRNRAYEIIRSCIKLTYGVADLSAEQQSALVGELSGSREFTLWYVNIFRSGPMVPKGEEHKLWSTHRGIEELEGPLGDFFRFCGKVTWYDSDHYMMLRINATIVGLDDDCTYIKFNCTNKAFPPVINYWGCFERTARLAEIRTALEGRSRRYDHDRSVDEDDDDENDDDEDDDDLDLIAPVKAPEPALTKEQFQALWKEAGQGNAAAQLRVGNALRDDQEYEKAARCYRFASDQGNYEAELQLGLLMRDGLGCELNKEESFAMCRRAAVYGRNAEAIYQVGYCVLNGIGTICGTAEAYKWYLEAAGLGHAQAALQVAYLLDKYDHLPIREGRGSKYWYRQAARRGCIDAQWKMACLSYEGRDLKTNQKEAFRWFRQAALLGDAQSQAKVGEMYLYQAGVDQNLRRAKYWSEKAVAQGSEEGAKTLQTVREELAKYGHADIH